MNSKNNPFPFALYPHNAGALQKGKDKWERRMDKYTDKELSAINEHEDELANRIHEDHTGPGVPPQVAKYTHGVKEHKRRIAKDIKKLRNKEKQEVWNEIHNN